MEWGRGEIIYLSLQCHHQNDSCIKMGSDESHFNVSAGSDGQSYRTVSTNHNLFEEKGEQKRYWTEVLPLIGQTGSRCSEGWARVNERSSDRHFFGCGNKKKIACSRIRIRKVWPWVWQRVNVFLRLHALVSSGKRCSECAFSLPVGFWHQLRLVGGFQWNEAFWLWLVPLFALAFPQKLFISAK